MDKLTVMMANKVDICIRPDDATLAVAGIPRLAGCIVVVSGCSIVTEIDREDKAKFKYTSNTI